MGVIGKHGFIWIRRVHMSSHGSKSTCLDQDGSEDSMDLRVSTALHKKLKTDQIHRFNTNLSVIAAVDHCSSEVCVL